MSTGRPIVYLATGNPHKLKEFSELVQAHGAAIDLRGAGEIGGMPDVEETGQTFEENALLKAQALAIQVDDAWVLSDDSGLVVDALDGKPGVQSARFAGIGATASANNLKLLREMHSVVHEKRTARFICVLCLLRKNAPARFFTGVCEGHIMTVPTGDEGFGYDPLFTPVGYTATFASLGPDIKHQLSHRGKAAADLVGFLQSQEFTGA